MGKEKSEVDKKVDKDFEYGLKMASKILTVVLLAGLVIAVGVWTATMIIEKVNEKKTPDVSEVTGGDSGNATNGASSGSGVVDNPNPRVSARGNLVKIDHLEFYLPSNFTDGGLAGGGDEKVASYNLTNDDGWAEVKIYVEKTGKDARDYLLSKSPNLDIDDDTLIVNGWSWSSADTAHDAIQAWATNYGDYVYAIIMSVKLESRATDDADDMIEKTLYFDKLYK